MPLLVDGRDDATHTILLAHGAGAGMEHAGMQSLADAFVLRGMRVVRFEFPFMHARREGLREYLFTCGCAKCERESVTIHSGDGGKKRKRR